MAEQMTLLERVEVATGPLDDETLGELICLVLGRSFGAVEITTGDDGSDEFAVYSPGAKSLDTLVWSDYRWRAPDVSLDAAIALVERVRPGTCVLLSITPEKALCNLHERPLGVWGKWSPLGEGATPALALLAALLKSMEADHGR